MRVLITNSLVLAAIALAPYVSAAPYTTTTSSVDTYESYPNSTALAQGSGPSSVPNVRRDEIIQIQSLHDGSHFFDPIADLFGSIGMNTISDSIPLTEAQKAILEKLHDALGGAADPFIEHLPDGHPLSPLSSRSIEDRQIQNPLAMLGSLPVLSGNGLAPLLDLFSSLGIQDPTAPMTDLQKQAIAKLQAAISTAAREVAASFPKLPVLPLNHQVRSVEERSLGAIVSVIDRVPFLSLVLSPVVTALNSLGVTDGTPLDDAQKQALSKLQATIAEVVEGIKDHTPTVHIEHTREEKEHWDHRDHSHHDPHRDDHHSHDEHKDRGKSWDEYKDDTRPRDAHKDDNKPHDVHKDDHKSPNVYKEDSNVQNGHRGDDHCREPRDGQWDERHKWDDCKNHRDGNHRDGKDRDEDSSLLKISLGRQHHP